MNNKPRQRLQDHQIQISTSRLGKQSLPGQTSRPMLNMTNASKYQLMSKQLGKAPPIDTQKAAQL